MRQLLETFGKEFKMTEFRVDDLEQCLFSKIQLHLYVLSESLVVHTLSQL